MAAARHPLSFSDGNVVGGTFTKQEDDKTCTIYQVECGLDEDLDSP